MLKNFKTLYPFFRENALAIAVGMLCLIIVDGCQVYIPRVIKIAVDALTEGAATPWSLARWGGVIAGLALGMAVFRYVWRILIFGNSRKVEEKLRNLLYGHLQTLSIPYFRNVKTGDLMARSINDIEAVRMACGMGMVALLDGVVLGVAAIAFMLIIDVKLTLIALIPMPFIIVIGRRLSQKIHVQFRSVQDLFSDITEHVREAFAGIRVIKSYDRETWQRDRLEAVGKRYISANLRLALSMGLFFPAMILFTNVSIAVVIWLGGALTITGSITTGGFVAFMSYLNMLAWPMMAMGWVTTLLQRGAASMARINAVLDEEPQVKDDPDPIPLDEARGLIEFRNLTFSHPGQEEPALLDISLTMEPNQTVTLVGGTGSAKTTMLELLLRINDPPPGTVFLDGVDIRRIPLATLRSHIGYVSQDSFLFSDTIRGNLTLGGDGFTDEQLYAALERAEFELDPEELPDGLETRLGERGLTLSGGQRQRLTIARALLVDPVALILDDALSSVDTQTERRILDNILHDRKDRLTVIVSHRVGAMARADKIFVLKEGRLAEEGGHRELLAADREYARLYRRQSLEEELEEAA